MKNLWRKIASGALALAMMFTLAACGKENGGADAASVMVAAQQELTKVSSMRYTYAMEMAISAEGQSVEMNVDGTADVTMNPYAAKMTMNMDMLGMALKDVQVYMVSENGKIVAYTGMDMTGAGQNQWYRSQADDSGMNTEKYDAVESFELYMKNGSNFKAAGTDTVQGTSATRYEGVITSDMLEQTLEKSGSLESITSLLGEDYSGALALAMMFTLAACGKENGGADAASVMVAAQQELANVSSMRYTYAMEMAISAEGQSVEMKVDGTADVTMNPYAAKMTMNMDMLGMALKDVQIYMVSEGGQMVAYTGMDMTGAGQNQWYKSLADASGMNTDQYDAVESFELYMKNGSNFKAVGTDTVQGASATRYEGVITSDMLEDTLEESGSLDNITSLLGEDYGDVLASLSGIPITIWINDAGLPVKYVFDMTSMMTELLQSSEDSEDADATVDKFIMSMEVLGYNDVDAITVPQEVLDTAADVTEEAG